MDYDLAIIGAGWAGFNAALKAKELGLKVALVDKGPIGGTCLNLGCIPTKTLIQSAKVFSLAKKSANFGVEVTNPQINFSKIQERKEKIIQQLRSGMQFMLNGVDFFNAEAKILSPNEVRAGDKIIPTKFILIATGAKPTELPFLKFDGKKVISSDEILNLKEVPQSLLIIGGGVIGCEFASLFNILETRILVIEKMPQLLPGEDKEIARKLETIFKKKGIEVKTDTDAKSAESKDYDLVLVCVGRTPIIEGLGPANIYAAGDCTGEMMLAHFAAYQGRLVAESIANPAHPKNEDVPVVPNCIFTDPEIASVGLNEEKAKNQGKEIKISRFDFLGSGMARILDESEGFIKIISDAKSEEILGAAIIGPRSTELIGILTLAISAHLRIPQLRKTIFAHPTLSEAISDTLRENHEV